MRALLRNGVGWLLLSELAYTGMRLGTRAGAGQLPWAEIAAARFFGGAIVAIVSAKLQGKSLRVTDQKNAWLRSAFGTGGALALFSALGTKAISVGDATTLYATTPLWVAMLSGPVLHEKVRGTVWAGVAVGFVGVAVLLGARFQWSGGAGPVVLVGAVSYALALLRLRRMGPHESSEAIALHMSLFAGCATLLVALPDLKPVQPRAYLPLAIAANAILVQVLGRTFLLYKKHPKKPKALPTDDTPKKSGNMSLRRRREAKVKKARKKRAAHAETRASEIDERSARFPRRRY